MNGIDASVTDEADALSADPSLDPFNRDNGYSPKGATYARTFVERYRKAQVERVSESMRSRGNRWPNGLRPARI